MAWFDRNRHLYPPDWAEIAKAAKDAAGWRCVVCDAPHGTPGRVLTVHHLDHEPSNCAPENLLACCQSCHLKCQALRPRPASIEEAIERLRPWATIRDAQLAMEIGA